MLCYWGLEEIPWSGLLVPTLPNEIMLADTRQVDDALVAVT